MTPDEILAALDQVNAAVHDQFGAHHAARLTQFDHAFATTRMAVEHLADEEVREVELAGRIMARAKVHNNDEVRDPHGRDYDETARIKAGENWA